MGRSRNQNGRSRSSFKILIVKAIEKKFSGRPRGRWKENRIYLKKLGISTMNWADSSQDRDYWKIFVNMALNL